MQVYFKITSFICLKGNVPLKQIRRKRQQIKHEQGKPLHSPSLWARWPRVHTQSLTLAPNTWWRDTEVVILTSPASRGIGKHSKIQSFKPTIKCTLSFLNLARHSTIYPGSQSSFTAFFIPAESGNIRQKSLFYFDLYYCSVVLHILFYCWTLTVLFVICYCFNKTEEVKRNVKKSGKKSCYFLILQSFLPLIPYTFLKYSKMQVKDLSILYWELELYI